MAAVKTISEDDFLCHAVVSFLRRDRPVWLENFGIVLPVKSSRVCSSQKLGVISVYTEERLSLGFEKAAELVSFHRERYPTIVETKELARAVLTLKGQQSPSTAEERVTSKSLVLAIKNVRDECVKTGISRRLISLGVFLACHNRQGDSVQDWFGGADIFVDKPFREVVNQTAPKTFPQAELDNAWEPFEAAFGPALSTSSLMSIPQASPTTSANSSQALNKSAEVRAAVFRAPAQSVGTARFIYCTDGFRLLRNPPVPGDGTASASDHRYEITFQLEVPHEEDPQLGTSSEQASGAQVGPSTQISPPPAAPHWPFELLSLVGPALSVNDPERGWFGIWDGCSDLFTQATGSRRSKASSGKPTGLLAVRPSTVAPEQVDNVGPFIFVNLLALMQDEIAFAAAVGPGRLLSILRHRNRHEVSRIDRASVVLRTQHELPGSIQTQVEKDHRSESAKAEVASTVAATTEETFSPDNRDGSSEGLPFATGEESADPLYSETPQTQSNRAQNSSIISSARPAPVSSNVREISTASHLSSATHGVSSASQAVSSASQAVSSSADMVSSAGIRAHSSEAHPESP